MIETLRQQHLLSDALLDAILRELHVPANATYRILGLSSDTDESMMILGLSWQGLTEVELLKFESARERVNAGYVVASNTLLLANMQREVFYA